MQYSSDWILSVATTLQPHFVVVEPYVVDLDVEAPKSNWSSHSTSEDDSNPFCDIHHKDQ